MERKSEFLKASGTANEIFKVIAHAVLDQGGSDDNLRCLLQNNLYTKKFVQELGGIIIRNTFFIPLNDNDVPERFQKIIPSWYNLAREFDYDGIIAWQVTKDFIFKQHAPVIGPCYEDWKYLQNWKLKNDEPTGNSIAFWIPRLVPDSIGKNVKEQMGLLADFRKRFELPKNHLSSFGSAALLSGLILTHFRIAEERVPPDPYWTRTDTLRVDDHRLALGPFDEDNLGCDDWDRDDGRSGHLGCFPLGVELLK